MSVSSFNEFLDNTKVTDYFINNKCSECGNCCSRFLPLSNYEINTIKAYIKRNNIKQQTHSVNVMAKQYWDFTCPFLDDTKQNHKCTIYAVRPQICKSFTCRKFINAEIDKDLYKIARKKVDAVATFFGDMG